MSTATILPCPACAGTGSDTAEDRHADTRQDTCARCGGTGQIPARTGEIREAPFDPATGRPFEAATYPLGPRRAPAFLSTED